ncbi:YceI family protein [Patescibacteria group bacterium]|nr:YceI family protein [Patescibacteria group bacterium]
MNSKTYLLLGLLLIVILAYIWFKQKNTQTKTNTYSNQPSNNSQSTSMTENNQPFNDGLYQISSDNQINWQGSKTLIANYKDTGTLNLKNGQLTIQDGQITASSFVFNMASLKANSTGRGEGASGLEKHLKSADFFDVEQYPEAIFNLKSATVDKESANNSYQINGDLTIKNITKPISFSAEVVNQSEELKLTAEIKLDRTLWDIRYGSDKFFDNLANNVIDDIITVTLNLTATKQ